MKLSARLTVVFGISGLVVVALIASIAWLLAAREVRASVDDDLETRAGVLDNLRNVDAEALAEFGRSPAIPTDVFGLEGSGGQVFDSTGEHIGENVIALPITITDELRDGEAVLSTETTDGREYRVYTVRLPEDLAPALTERDAYGVQLYRDISSQEEAITQLALRLALLGAVGIALVAAGSWVVGRRLAAPIRELTLAAERLTEPGAPARRIEVARGDEVGQLADTFNRMASALEIGREQQQRLVADASHELRTPLTSLRMRADFLASFDDLRPEHRSIVEGAVVDVEQLTALVTDLIDLAADSGTPDENAERRRLADIATEVATRTEIASQVPITVTADDSAATVYVGMIRRAVQNLVDNAVKYGPTEGPIRIEVDRHRITVVDRGPGIPDEDLAHVFDRFFRSPKARSRPGNGIGLAIVKQVADVHGGDVWADNDADGGAHVGFSVRAET
ncbi:MAG: HAMP domain-containing sensor histidine kinase [Actinomycetota bacterium]